MNQIDIVQMSGQGGGIGQAQRKLQYLTSSDADADPEKVRGAAREFASYFLHMLIREMRKSVPKNPILYGGKTEELFQDFLDEEMASRMVASNQLGLADAIYQNLQNLLKQSQQGADIEKRGTAYGIDH
jgi:flagellar protein FlgJ